MGHKKVCHSQSFLTSILTEGFWPKDFDQRILNEGFWPKDFLLQFYQLSPESDKTPEEAFAQPKVTCPICRKVSDVPGSDITKLPMNFYAVKLLELIDYFKLERKVNDYNKIWLFLIVLGLRRINRV